MKFKIFSYLNFIIFDLEKGSFHRDIKFILEEVRPEITQDRELLFGGLEEILDFSVAIHKQFINIVAIEGLTLKYKFLNHFSF